MKVVGRITGAANIVNAPAGTIQATTVQGAIDELASDVANLSAEAISATETGSNAFPGGTTTDTVTDAAILDTSFICISPTGTKVGEWSVVSSAGSFTVTSTDTEESTATYDYAIINDGTPGESGGGAWGDITGTLSDQTDLQSALNGKASLNGNVNFNTVNTPDYDDFRATGSFTNQQYTPDATRLMCNPISGMLWHDLAAFSKIGAPLQEVSADGSTGWTTDTLDTGLFAQKGINTYVVIDAALNKGVRWTWSSNVAWAYIQWVMLAFGYTGSGLVKTIKIESSSDGTNWTERFLGTQSYESTPMWAYCAGSQGDSRFRLTITVSASSGTVNMAAIQLLTARWGDQGRGEELQYPYIWDGDQNVEVQGILTAKKGIPPDRRMMESIECDFLNAVNTTWKGLYGTAVSSGTVTTVTSTAGHYGVVGLRDSTTANGGYYIATGVETFQLQGGENFECVFRSIGTRTTAQWKMGFHDTVAAQTAPTDGAWVQVSAQGATQVLTAYCNNNAGPTAGVETYTLTNTTWYRLLITVNDTATAVTFKLFNMSGSQLWTTTITDNIPNTSGRVCGAGVIAGESTTDAAATIIEIDEINIWCTKPIAR